MNKRLSLISYLHYFIGSPYQWGGSGPYAQGYDCSGLVQEGLASIGLWGKGDTTAQGMYAHFSPASRNLHPDRLHLVQPGDIVFFGHDTKSITHIGVAINQYQFIEAGGGSQTVKGGMVRIRPFTWRKDLVAILDVIKE